MKPLLGGFPQVFFLKLEHWEQDINLSFLAIFVTKFVAVPAISGLKWSFLFIRLRKKSCSVSMSDHKKRVHEGLRRPATEKLEAELH